jgi:molybdopterin converting factor small subunit
MRVLIPSALRDYTRQMWVEADGSSLGSVLDDLDRRYPGIRFRMINEQEKIRPHIRFFVDGEALFDLDRALEPRQELLIVQALSGG